MNTKILIALAIATLLASCQKSESENFTSDPTHTEVTFSSAITTKAVGATWELDDKIGVTMFSTDETTENVKYYYGADGTFISTDPLRYPSIEKVDFVAYYPYSTEVTDSKISINTAAQSSEDGVKALDFMIARTADCSCVDESNPTLNFSRKMAKVVFNITRIGDAESAELSGFRLSGSIVDGTLSVVNAEDNTVALGTTGSSISMYYDGDKAEAIIIPQTLSSATIILSNDGNYQSTTISGVFEEGKQYTYNLQVGRYQVSIGEATITDWNEVSSSDIYYEDTPTYTLSEINETDYPDIDVWIVTDGGSLSLSSATDLRIALSTADFEGRKITLILPNITEIDEGVFFEHNALVRVELPNAVTIGYEAFSNCSALTSAELPNAVTIGYEAFSNCSALTSIELPNAETIEYEAFRYCSALTSIELTNAETIGYRTFSNCSALTSIELPNAETIGYGAFSNCSALTSIELPNAETIGVNVFYNCSALTTINLPKATYIGEYGVNTDSANLTAVYLTSSEQISTGGNIIINSYAEYITLYLNSNKINSALTTIFNWKAVVYVDDEGNIVE